MPDVNDYLGQAKPWFARHCFGVIDALFAEDLPAAQSALKAAWAALRTAEQGLPAALDPDQRRAMEYVLIEFDFELVNQFNDPRCGEVHREVSRRISELAPLGPLSDQVQAFVLLSLIGMGTRRRFVEVDEAEMLGLLARVPDAVRTPNFWYYVVAWAYYNDNLRLLEEAYTEQMTRTTGWQDEYYWLRTNLMYLLVAGKASRNDVERTILAYRHPRQIIDFRNLFLLRVEQSGLWDSQLEQLLTQRELELEALRGSLPESQPRTMRVRGRTM